MTNRKFLWLAVASAAMLAAGCSTTTANRAVADADATSKLLESRAAEMRLNSKALEASRLAAQNVQRPYIAGNSMPLARDVVMPEALRKGMPITALFGSTLVDLATAAQQLSSAVGFQITVTPDAALPPSSFQLKGTSAQGGQAGQAARVVLKASNQPIWLVLDDLARQAHVNWRPVAGGAEFYRLESQVFHLSALPATATTSASLGRNGGSGGLFESQSKTGFATKEQDNIKGIQTAVDALLTTGGKAVISPESQTLVVTDTKDALARVAEYVKGQNKIHSSRVRLVVEAIEVVDKDLSEVGVDWNLMYSQANVALGLSSVASLTGSQAGATTFSIPTGFGNAAGTTLVVKALNEIGTVVNRRSFPLLTTSGRPVTQALRTTFSYVDQVQASSQASSGTTTTAPTVTQKDETVGTFLTVVPTAKPDGMVFLSVSFDVTSALPLVPFTVGSGSSAVSVQQKTINGAGVIQELPMRNGQTVVIGGIDTQVAQNTIRRLGRDVPMLLGGSDAASVTRTRMLLLVTAVVEQGL